MERSAAAASSERLELLRQASKILLVSVLIAVASVGCRHQAVLPDPYVAVVVNRQSDSITALDLESAQILGTVPVAPLPDLAVKRPHSRQVYVVSESGKVNVIAFPPLAVVHQYTIGQAARDLAFSPDGTRAYTLEPRKGEIVFLDCATMRQTARVEVARGLRYLALTADGKTLVASDPVSNRLYFVSATTPKLLGSVEVGKSPGPLLALHDSVFVADTGDKKISVVDIPSRVLIANIEVGSNPSGLALKPDGGELFVLSAQGSDMTILDTSADDVEQVVPTGQNPVAAAFTKDSSMLYVASAGDGFVTEFSVADRSVLGTVHAGVTPRALALTPNESFLAVTDSTSGALAILRTSPLALVTAVPVGADPVDVIVPGWRSEK